METPAGGSARQRFLTDDDTPPKHFRAATAGSLNSRHSFSQLLPSDLRKTARDSRQSRERFSFKLHFLSPFVLTSFVCFRGQFIVRVHSWYVLFPYGLRSNRWDTLRDRRNTLRFRASGRHQFARLHHPANPLVDS